MKSNTPGIMAGGPVRPTTNGGQYFYQKRATHLGNRNVLSDNQFMPDEENKPITPSNRNFRGADNEFSVMGKSRATSQGRGV